MIHNCPVLGISVEVKKFPFKCQSCRLNCESEKDCRKKVEPTFKQKIGNYKKERKEWLKAGKPKREKLEQKRILNICKRNVCSYFNGSSCTHKACGCPITLKDNWWGNKTKWATTSCPVKLWGPHTEVKNIGFITAYFNPAKYTKRLTNYHLFREQLNTDNLLTIEGVYGQPEIEDALHIPCKDIMWQKERLLNIGIQKIIDDFDAICWLDCDIAFSNPNWIEETRQVLQFANFVQPFSFVKFQGTDWKNCKGAAYYKSGHPGFAWAIRSKVLKETQGLLDTAICGGADRFMWAALTGRKGRKPFIQPANYWASKIRDDVFVSYVAGEINHFYHGDRENRKYMERELALEQMNFSPVRHLKSKPNTGWEWSDEASQELKDYLINYFLSRKEDG